MLQLVVKAALSGAIIAVASEVARRWPRLGSANRVPAAGERADDVALCRDGRDRPEVWIKAASIFQGIGTRMRASSTSHEQLALTIVRFCLLLLLLSAAQAFAHDLSEANKNYVQSIDGPAPVPFFYLGAKHMVTGIDHLLFLVGVVFFLYRLRDVVLYVSMFTIGHSTTLLLGVLLGTGLNSSLVDAIIGFSVMYKAFENLGGLQRLGLTINTKLAVLVFGLFHGLGLATKLQDLAVKPEGLLANLISFNVGVEAGQVIALAVVVTLLNFWRATGSFRRGAAYANMALLAAGLALTIYQLTGYIQL